MRETPSVQSKAQWFNRLRMKLHSDRERVTRLSKESGWLAFGQIMGVLGSLALVRVLTGYLAPADYGRMALALTIGTLVCQVSLSGVMPGIMRYYTLAVERGDVQNYTADSRRLMAYGTAGTILLGVLLISGAIMAGHASWLWGLLLAIAFTQVSSYNATLSSIQNAARQRNIVAVHGAVDPWVKIGLIVAILSISKHTPEAVIFAYLFAAVLILASQLFFFSRLVNRTTCRESTNDTPWLREMFNYSKPFMIFNLPTWAQASSDRWALQTFTAGPAVGQYAVLLQLGYAPVAMAVGLITGLVGPILHQRAGDGTDAARNRNVWRISWWIALFGLGVTAVAFLLAFVLHEWIFKLLVAPAYRDVSYLLPWMLLAGGIYSASQVIALKLMSDLNTRALVVPKVLTSILAVALNFAGAWVWGIDGVIVASVIFSVSIFAWMAVLARKPQL
jgi:O-antigen/teichoic acid export membrane protein